MLRQVWRHIMLWVSENKTLETIAKKHGMKPGGFARKFLAGETLDEAMDEIKQFNDRGIGCTTTILGESVTNPEMSYKARDINLEILERIHQSGATPWESHVSVKLTQLGLDISRELCMENMTPIMQKAKKYNIFVRIDMEIADIVQRTLDIWDEFWSNGYDNLGVALQCYLYRTMGDVNYVSKKGGRIRLVKGAYYEPKTVAFQKNSMVDMNYERCLDLLLKVGNFPAVATHNECLIERAKELAKKHGRTAEDFEFQQCYGIRTDCHNRRLQEGYKLRTTIPYGKEWFPYYNRRLAERPANALWVLRNMYYSRKA